MSCRGLAVAPRSSFSQDAAEAAGTSPVSPPASPSGTMSSLRNRPARPCVRIDNTPFLRLGQQQCRARAWDGSLVRKVPTAQALPAELAATPSRTLVAPRLGLPTCAHLVPFQCRISVLFPAPLAK